MPSYRVLAEGINYAPGNKRAEHGAIVTDLTPQQVAAFGNAIEPADVPTSAIVFKVTPAEPVEPEPQPEAKPEDTPAPAAAEG